MAKSGTIKPFPAQMAAQNFLSNMANFAQFAQIQRLVKEETAVEEPYRITSNNTVICTLCNCEMRKQGVVNYICMKCGYKNEFNIDVEPTFTLKDNYTTNSNSATTLQIMGPNAHKYQNNLRKNTTNYKKKQYKDTHTQMEKFIRQYNGAKIPVNIITIASEYYFAVQQHDIKRSFNRIATMAECLYRVCNFHGIGRKPKEIIDIFNIEQSDLSKGSNILNKLHSQGLLKDYDFGKSNYNESLLSRYFNCLGIKRENGLKKYFQFCCDIIDFTVKYKIANNNIVSTKCAGAIYLLTTYDKTLKVSKDQISKSCDISKSTFTEFFKTVSGLLKKTDPLYRKCQVKIRNILARNGIQSVFTTVV